MLYNNEEEFDQQQEQYKLPSSFPTTDSKIASQTNKETVNKENLLFIGAICRKQKYVINVNILEITKFLAD